MSNDIELVRKYIELIKETSVSEFSYENEVYKIHINMNMQNNPVVNYNPAPVVKQNIEDRTSSKSTAINANYSEIKSPFVGTYYSSPGPGKPVYVKVGDKVKKGQTLCILEAMKIMNEIESEFDGIIQEICIDNESLVEYGEVLFKIGK